MAKENTNKKGFVGVLKEAWRKFLVALKRRPSMIPLVVLAIGFLVYSLHLTNISDTTAKIQGPGMGLAGFATMLFSMLSLVCYLNAFPQRKPVNKPMLVLMFLMNAVIIFCDVYYRGLVYSAVTRPDNPIKIDQTTSYILYADYYLQVHMIVLIVGLVLVALLPFYSKLIRKINTNIDVEDNGSIGEIDISGEN